MAFLDCSPRAFAVVSRGDLQRLKFSVRAFFPSGCCDVPWGRASAPMGVAPEALEECVHSCKIFDDELSIYEC
jgi:hypothetical protein